MSTRLQGILVAGVGLVAIHLAATGSYRDYLKPAMRLPLLATGGVLLLLGLVTVARARSRRPRHPGAGASDQDHRTLHPEGDHHHAAGGPRVAWLLAALLVTILLVRPPALGADAARRDTASALPPPTGGFEPLPPPRDGAVDLTIRSFLNRARFDEDESLAGVPVRLAGFVVRDPEITDGYQLTRFVMTCCAGDAFPAQIAVHGLDGPPPPDDTWVEVIGEWIPPTDPDPADRTPDDAVELLSQTQVPTPADPYE